MSNLLAGVRVLDLTNVLSGPICSYQLAQLGADVIKVEVPGTGDLARQLGSDPALNRKYLGASFIAQNSGKRSLTLDLKRAAARAIFFKLVTTADVLVENFRPGVMKRLGVSYEALKKIKPSLIYCAISGFGQEGPLQDNPAYDQVVQGFSGVMSITGSEESGPLRAGYPVADTAAGMNAAFGIAAALYRSAKTGEGEFIDVSMMESTLVALGWAVSNYLLADHIPKLMGNENMTASPSGAFRTKEGLLNIAANKQQHFVDLCAVVGRTELATDPRFADREDRRRNRKELKQILEEALSAKTALEWHVLLTKASIPAGPVLSLPQALHHPQIEERGLIQTFDMPELDRPVRVMRTGFKLASGDPAPVSPPPVLGEHTDELLGELGYSASEIAAFRAARVV
jgi:crotonobetainyl-CoA:carnitine CoA-transferase CaiB-like acyl-CoA transferase